MEEYKAYRIEGRLYVDRVVAPRFTMLFEAKDSGRLDGKVIDETQINRFVAQSDANETKTIARWMREAGDCAIAFLKAEKSN